MCDAPIPCKDSLNSDQEPSIVALCDAVYNGWHGETPFPCDEWSWDYIDDTGDKLLNNTLVEKARVQEMSVIRELGVWEVVDRPHDEVVFGTRWFDINKGRRRQTVLPQSAGSAGVQASSRLLVFHSNSPT